jgi:hypothetical protein
VDDELDPLVDRAAESADETPEAFAAAGTAGIPNPAGVLIASEAADDFAAGAL